VYKDGELHLVEPQNKVGPKPSANNLFNSMAEGLGEHAVAIVLSGTGSDGATGMRDIKAAGGITIAQEPGSAKYDGMPKAAIHTGNVDLILPPRDMGTILERLITEPNKLAVVFGDPVAGDEYAQITRMVRQRTAFRLDEYKIGTVKRRIARRLGLLGLHTLKDYVAYLAERPEEAQLLVRDTFISVTAFFRDSEPYRALEQQIVEIVRHADTGVVRCWVAGCATGQEAYSVAMLFEEAMRQENRADLQYMIFASDLDDDALDHARTATYPLHLLEELPKDLRKRYVEVVGNFGRIQKSIRNRLVFARQNVIDDPPFARLDLVSCRNLLIYLNPPVQRRLLEVFHYSLKPGGTLFLGRSETADARPDLFTAKNSRARLYGRLEGATDYVLPASQFENRQTESKRAETSSPVSCS
jgi:two-component system CheB/CheR fusion protein